MNSPAVDTLLHEYYASILTEHACLTSLRMAGSHPEAAKVPVMVSWPDYVSACHVLTGFLLMHAALLSAVVDM